MSKQNSANSTREKAAAARAAQEAADKRRERTVKVVGAIGVLAVVAAIIGAAFIARGDGGGTSPTEIPSDAALPAGVSAPTYGVKVGTGGPTLETYEDFQCPACGQFEQLSGSTISKLVDGGKVTLQLQMLNFLDRNLNNDASLRATAAFGCAVDAGKTLEYHSTVYANQPEQEGTGYTDEQLLQFGKDAGITGAEYDTFAACVDSKKYFGWSNLSQRYGEEQGVQSTPTVLLDGQPLEPTTFGDPAALTKAIEAAAQKK